jgi:ATP-dependent DNA helicase RecQ
LLQDIAGSVATLRHGQGEVIDTVVAYRRRVLLVQRTGWGKSAVYFIATRLLRDSGVGQTILVSPLLALMRDQIRIAGHAGVVARDQQREPGRMGGDHHLPIERDEVDLLLVSPERSTIRRSAPTSCLKLPRARACS